LLEHPIPPTRERVTALARWLVLALVVIVLDQWTKHLILEHFRTGGPVRVTSFFDIVLAFNTGAAFSFLADADGWQRAFFIGVAIAASAFIVYLLWTHRGGKLFPFGLALILGGAIGNLWDRVALGHVVDFLLFHYAGWSFPAFNVADSAITCGAAALIIDSFATTRADRGSGASADPKGS
jgi:signal peptidase II